MQLSCDSMLELKMRIADGSICSGNMRRSLSGDYVFSRWKWVRLHCCRHMHAQAAKEKCFVVSWTWVAVFGFVSNGLLTRTKSLLWAGGNNNSGTKIKSKDESQRSQSTLQDE